MRLWFAILVAALCGGCLVQKQTVQVETTVPAMSPDRADLTAAYHLEWR